MDRIVAGGGRRLGSVKWVRLRRRLACREVWRYD